MSDLTMPWFWQRFTTPDGKPLSGGKLYFFVAGSTDVVKPVYTDHANTMPWTQPLVLDAGGVAPQYYPEAGLYCVQVKDSTGALISTRDYVSPSDSGSSASYRVKSTATDTSPDYLYEKLQAGAGIVLGTVQTGGNVDVQVAHNGTLRVTSSDSTPQTLQAKLQDSDTVVWTKTGSGTEQMQASVPTSALGKVAVESGDTAGFLAGKVAAGDGIEIVGQGLPDNRQLLIAVDSSLIGNSGLVKADPNDQTAATLVEKVITDPGLYATVIGDTSNDKLHIGTLGYVAAADTNDVLATLNRKISAGSGVTITPTSSQTYGTVLSISASGSNPSGATYASTMYIANAVQTLAPNLISRSELICLFVPTTDVLVRQGQESKFGCFLSQGGTGIMNFTLRDEQYRLIAYSYQTTNPAPQVFLELACGIVFDPVTGISQPSYTLACGGRYYLGINWTANGIQLLGDDAVQTNNTQPYTAYKVDNLSGVPAQLTGGGEAKQRPFIRLYTKVA